MSDPMEDLVEAVARDRAYTGPNGPLTDEEWAKYDQHFHRRRAREYISAINASGTYKVVPVVATEAMLRATIDKGRGDYVYVYTPSAEDMAFVWSAMISAVEG